MHVPQCGSGRRRSTLQSPCALDESNAELVCKKLRVKRGADSRHSAAQTHVMVNISSSHWKLPTHLEAWQGRCNPFARIGECDWLGTWARSVVVVS
jgi:hypothetical protein